MSGKAFHFKGVSVVLANMRCEVRLDRFSAQFQQAQFWLDSQIMTDMEDYMPKVTGNFIHDTRLQSEALAGTGMVVAGTAPMGRYLYEGKVMVEPWKKPHKKKDGEEAKVDEELGHGPMLIPGKGLRFHKGAKLVVTSRNLDTSKSNNWTPHWFDAAKAAHGHEWVAEVKRIAGGK